MHTHRTSLGSGRVHMHRIRWRSMQVLASLLRPRPAFASYRLNLAPGMFDTISESLIMFRSQVLDRLAAALGDDVVRWTGRPASIP